MYINKEILSNESRKGTQVDFRSRMQDCVNTCKPGNSSTKLYRLTIEVLKNMRTEGTYLSIIKIIASILNLLLQNLKTTALRRKIRMCSVSTLTRHSVSVLPKIW